MVVKEPKRNNSIVIKMTVTLGFYRRTTFNVSELYGNDHRQQSLRDH